MTGEPAREADWTACFEGSFRASFCELIRGLSISRLQRYPPPKNSGLPLGHEARVLGRFLTGRSSLLDQSALSRVYRSFASSREKLVYRACVLGEPLPQAEWSGLIGAEAVSLWLEKDLLREQAGRRAVPCFRVISVNDVTVVVDPLELSFRHRVHIGQDSLNMVEFLGRAGPIPGKRILDVGTGSGLILLTLARGRDEAVGVDINPRAVRLASLNVEINQRSNCRIEERDILDPRSSPGSFDLITWNTPFMFFPETLKELSVDGYGGSLGISITLRFIERLPELLNANGAAHLLSAAPVLADGENRLETELARLAAQRKLDITASVLQSFWVPSLREFHRQHGVRRFESVMLRVERGSGRLKRVGMGPARLSVDAARRMLYAARTLRSS